MFVADDPDYMAYGIQCKGVSPYDDRYSSAWKFSARLGLVLGHAIKVWASRLLPLGQYPRMRVQQDDGSNVPAGGSYTAQSSGAVAS